MLDSSVKPLEFFCFSGGLMLAFTYAGIFLLVQASVGDTSSKEEVN